MNIQALAPALSVSAQILPEIAGTRPSRLASLCKARMLPPRHGKAMLNGRKWMAKPELENL